MFWWLVVGVPAVEVELALGKVVVVVPVATSPIPTWRYLACKQSLLEELESPQIPCPPLPAIQSLLT